MLLNQHFFVHFIAHLHKKIVKILNILYTSLFPNAIVGNSYFTLSNDKNVNY